MKALQLAAGLQKLRMHSPESHDELVLRCDVCPSCLIEAARQAKLIAVLGESQE